METHSFHFTIKEIVFLVTSNQDVEAESQGKRAKRVHKPSPSKISQDPGDDRAPQKILVTRLSHLFSKSGGLWRRQRGVKMYIFYKEEGR